MAEGHWLTSLFVAPALRGQAIAATLVQQSLAHTPGPVWLFCNPELLAFYQRLGFTPCQRLPEALANRLARYTRSKPLVALSHGVPV